MQPNRTARRWLATVILAVAIMMPFAGYRLWAAQQPGLGSMQIGIIVTTTRAEAEDVMRQLAAGWDFGVIAKERSIDPTSIDGGYMGIGRVPDIRPELGDPLAGKTVGQLSNIVAVPNGFAILKVLPTAPPTEDLDTRDVQAKIQRGDIQFGPTLAGLGQVYALFRGEHKPDGWEHDLNRSCSLRTQAYEQGIARIKEMITTAQAGGTGSYSDTDLLESHSNLGQLYAYAGDMKNSIKELTIARTMAETVAPRYVLQLEETLGDAYLHLAEMENGAYQGATDLDIFPPQHPNTGLEIKQNAQQAVEHFTRYLAQTPDDLEVKWLLNLAYLDLGEYPAGVPSQYLIPPSDFESKQDIGRFTDVAQAAGLNVSREAGGVIIDDFENNGLLDIVVSSMEVCDPIRYFHNNGDGTFTDRTAEAGLAHQLGGLNIVQADYNNDGCMDILILRGGWEYAQRKSLLRNNCDGTFTDVTDSAGLGDSITSTQTAVWADIDNDGYLDLFIGNENSPSQLFHNKGDGTFEEISHAAGVDQTTYAKGVTAADYDQDGYVDFYVSTFAGANLLYHNNGNGTFTEIGRQAGVQAPAVSFASWFFDYDNDGWPDLFVASYPISISESLKTYTGQPHSAETLKLYRNKHDGTFEDVTAKVGLDKVFMPMGAGFGDVNNDGYLDIYLGMGNPSYTALLPHALLLNHEGKSFVDITASSGTGELHKGHGIVFADLDRSGNEAIVAEVGGAVPGDRHTMRVFENPGNNNDWINIRLSGVKSNRSGVGAQIKLTVTDDGQPREIYRTVGQTSSFGAGPMEQHVGLGHDARIDAIDVWWPASNTHQHFADVEKNQFIEVKEFSNQVNPLNRSRFQLGMPSLAGKKKAGSQTQATLAAASSSLPGGASHHPTALPR